MALINCPECGNQVSDTAFTCPACGKQIRDPQAGFSSKSFVATLLLCFFFGTFGIHRFYVGKIGTGILQLITLGGLGIWTLIDFIIIIIGKFKDKSGAYIKNN